MNRHHPDRGAVTAMTVVLAVALLALGGLIFDGSRTFAARRDANNLALQSARVAAQHVDTEAAYGGTWRIDPIAADTAARDFLATQGIEPVEVLITDDRVEVTIHMTIDTPMLAVLGSSSRAVEATAAASPARGVRGEGT